MSQPLDHFGIVSPHSGVMAGGEFLPAGGEPCTSINPATGQSLGVVTAATDGDYERVLTSAVAAFDSWRRRPPPQRGEVIRQIGAALREHKEPLAQLITLEAGKILSEARGEVQEMIDICDFAVGLSRQLYGLTIASERPSHRLFEQWHPLGPVGVITAFNFPTAVWAWNAALAAVCGDVVVWKPSPLTPLTAIAVQQIIAPVLKQHDAAGVLQLCLGGREIGERMADDVRLPLISATGSCAMGRQVAVRVAQRLGRTLLELGGNNGAIVAESADLELTSRAVVFGALGTAGQRCTTLRRLIVHENIVDDLLPRLLAAYRSVTIGDPRESATLVGPLIREAAVERFIAAVQTARQQGGEVLTGGKRIDRPGFFVQPTIIRVPGMLPIVREETFGPLLYVLTYHDLDAAIALQNDVPQGLSSALFTDRLREAEQFLSPWGSDCGIANVNIGTSGAEIGGAFGGEKETGGGRESGSDAWKVYMRRQTCTINFGRDLPLAQGVTFGSQSQGTSLGTNHPAGISSDTASEREGR